MRVIRIVNPSLYGISIYGWVDETRSTDWSRSAKAHRTGAVRGQPGPPGDTDGARRSDGQPSTRGRWRREASSTAGARPCRSQRQMRAHSASAHSAVTGDAHEARRNLTDAGCAGHALVTRRAPAALSERATAQRVLRLCGPAVDAAMRAHRRQRRARAAEGPPSTTHQSSARLRTTGGVEAPGDASAHEHLLELASGQRPHHAVSGPASASSDSSSASSPSVSHSSARARVRASARAVPRGSGSIASSRPASKANAA